MTIKVLEKVAYNNYYLKIILLIWLEEKKIIRFAKLNVSL